MSMSRYAPRGAYPGMMSAFKAAGRLYSAYSQQQARRQQQQANRTAQAEHQLESKHGGAVYSATYQGSFGRASSGTDSVKAAYLKSGCGIRDYISGTVSAAGTNQTVWVGHCSYRPDAYLRVVCQSIVRKLYYKATNRDITDLDTLILPNTNAVNINIEYLDVGTGAVGVSGVTVTAATDTLRSVADKLTNIFIADIANKAAREYTYVYMYQGSNEGLALSLTGMTVDLMATSHLKLQNVTTEPTSTNVDYGNAADVRNFPLQGVMYCGSGNFAMQKAVREAAPSVYNPAFEGGGQSGLMVPGYYNSGTGASFTTTLQPEFTLPQVSEQLTNVNGSKHVKLGPGVVKADHLKYQKRMKFNTFINNLVVVPHNVTYTAGPPVVENLYYQRTHRGQFSLFALTELMHSDTNAQLAVWYEIWWEVYAKVTIVHEEQYLLPRAVGGVLNVTQQA